MRIHIILCRYIWIGGSGQDIRSKAKSLPKKEGGYKPSDLPVWNFDGCVQWKFRQIINYWITFLAYIYFETEYVRAFEQLRNASDTFPWVATTSITPDDYLNAFPCSSSTGQAPGDNSEVIIYPQAVYKDPFRPGDHILVLCDCYTPAGEPLPSNTR